MVRKVVLCSLALCWTAGLANANILINGGFEDGPTGSISSPIPGWSSWGGSGWHHDDAGQTLDTKAIKFWWDDAGLWQDFAVTGGTNYSISAEALSPANDPLTLWNGLLKVEYYDSSIGTGPGQALLEVELDRFYSATDPVGQWVTIGGAAVAPAGADVGRVVLKINDWQAGVGGVINFDNVAVTPEPATLALLGLGGAALLRRRRA